MRDEADDAGVAFRPIPGIGLEGAAFAEERVDFAADILDGRYAGAQQRAMRRIPFRENPPSDRGRSRL